MTDLALTSLMLFGSTISCKFWSFWWALNMIIISNLGTYRCISLFRIYNHLILDYTFSSLSSSYYYSLQILNCVIQKQYNLIEKNIINQATEFVVNDKKHHVPIVSLSNRNDPKLLKQLKSGFKRTITWNKYQLDVTTEAQNQSLDYLLDTGFQGVNRLFVYLKKL